MRFFTKYTILFFVFINFYSLAIFADTTSTSLAIAISKKISDLFPSPIHVDVFDRNGVISLSAILDQKTAAAVIEIAAEFPGVIDVDTTHLTNALGEHFSYALITAAKIMGTYRQQKIFGQDTAFPKKLPIEINISNNIVFLSGTVDNHNQLAAAINVARRVPGVMRVISKLNIRYVTVRTSG